jgi:hypothetical protein
MRLISFQSISRWVAIAITLASHALATPKGIEWVTDKVAADNGHGGRLCSLLAVGGFRANVGEHFASVRDRWLSSHPTATLSSVCEYKEEGSSKLTLRYVWISDGYDNLNVELVRQGCVAGDYMYVPKGQKLDVPSHVYQQFVEKVREAERKAKSERLGIWGISERAKKGSD